MGRWPFAEGAFDVIVSNSTLDHFGSLAEVLGSLRGLRRSPADGELAALDDLLDSVVALRNSLPFALLHRLGLVPLGWGRHVGRAGCAGCCGKRARGARPLRRDALPAGARGRAGSPVRESRGLAVRQHVLGSWDTFEILARSATRSLAGYFIAVRAVKR